MRSLEQLDQWIAKTVRGWSSKVSGTQRSPELLEIRRDILNDIRDHIQPKGNGRNAFPYNRIVVRTALFEEALSQDDDLEQTVSALLDEAGCPSPGLRLEVSAAQTDDPLHIDYLNVKAEPPAIVPKEGPRARLIVERGEADSAEYAIESDVINLGRTKEVTSEREGLRRRNHIAFADTETTVSREHAIIRYDRESGKFLLFDSRSQRGTNIFRDGRRVEVPKNLTHGVQLRSGDEIHLGNARLRFELDPT